MELNAAILGQLERLAAAGIQLLPAPGLERHFVLERAGIFILVENRDGTFGNIGAPGRVLETGFAPLVEREGAPVFVTKMQAQAATADDVEQARKLVADLAAALR